MPDGTLAAALLMFPSPGYDEVALSPYLGTTADGNSPLGGFSDGPPGLDLRYRRSAFGIDIDKDGERSERLSAHQSELRVARDDAGALRLDRVSVQLPFVGLRVRPDLGDNWDLTLLASRREWAWAHGLAADADWRLYSPILVSLLGFSDTDQDPDRRAKYQISALGGVGGEILGRLVGPVGLHLRAEGEARTQRRFARDVDDKVRHEIVWTAQAGVAGIGGRQGWLLDAWFEQISQWHPRDAGGRDGIDRQYTAAGIRLAGRFYRQPPEPDIAGPLDSLSDGLLDFRPDDPADLVPPPLPIPSPEALAENRRRVAALALTPEAPPVTPETPAVVPEVPTQSPVTPPETPRPPVGPTP